MSRTSAPCRRSSGAISRRPGHGMPDFRELNSRNMAHYIVLRRQSGPQMGELIGYAGMWRMYDEAHVTTIGVRQDLQGAGYGRVLFSGLVQAAYEMGAKWITLEVRASNEHAMRMYEGFGFKVIAGAAATTPTTARTPWSCGRIRSTHPASAASWNGTWTRSGPRSGASTGVQCRPRRRPEARHSARPGPRVRAATRVRWRWSRTAR